MLLNSLLFLFPREAYVSHVFQISHFKIQAHFTNYKLPVLWSFAVLCISPPRSLLASSSFKSALHLLLYFSVI